MTVRYWVAYPVAYILVGPFTKHSVLALECLAPYTPIRLITEFTP
jgi:hypothetical protein